MPGPLESDWPSCAVPPPLAAGEVHVWRVPVPSAGAEPPGWRALLDDEEKARVARKRFPADAQRELASRAALRVLLGAYLGREPASLAFAAEGRGKPVLAGVLAGERIEFNASHSGDWALLGFARGHRLGVDLERWRGIESHDLVRGFFSPGERAEWAEIDPAAQPTAFFDAWTRKEAYLKALGTGLMKPLDSFQVRFAPGLSPELVWCADDPEAPRRWRLRALAPASGYSAALAVAAEAASLRTFTLVVS